MEKHSGNLQPVAADGGLGAREGDTTRPMRWVLRFLAVCHFGWGGVLLLAAGWPALAAFRTLPHMSTGTIWTNLPNALLLSAMYALPPAALGAWMGLLGLRLWSPGARLRTTLLWTHGILLVLGSLAVYVGIHSVEAAEISSARGGGLLSPLAWIPLMFGLPILALAAFSLPAAMLVLPPGRTAGLHHETAPYGTRETMGRPILRLILAWVLLSCGFAVLVPSLWPTSEAEKAAKQTKKAAKQIEMLTARKKADLDALRALSRKPPEETAAVLRNVIMDGRLGAMRLTDQEATLTLVSANLPVAFECIDLLAAKSARAKEQLDKQGAVRSWADREKEDEYLRLTNSMSDLLSVLKDVKHVPAGLEPFLVQRTARKGPGRSEAISLMDKFDTLKDKRAALSVSSAVDDGQAAKAAHQGSAQMGNPMKAHLLDERYEVWSKALEELGTLSEEDQWTVGNDLLKVVMDENSPFRANAIRAIGNIRPPFIPAKSNLVEFVGDRKAEHDLRWQATIALGEMKLADQETIGVLCNALSDPDPELRWKSVEALSKFQQEAAPAYEDLAKATKDKDWRVRIGAAHALSYMGSISIPVLTSMLRVDDATVSVETIRVLGAMGHEADSAVAALVKTMKWPLEGFPEETIAALKKIGTPSAREALSASNR